MKRDHGKLLRLAYIHNQGEDYEFDEKHYFRINQIIIKKARIFGTVVARYDKYEPDKYTALTIDDGSDTIRIKLWSRKYTRTDGTIYDPHEMATNIIIGDTLDIIGKVRNWENEFYIIPSSMTIKNNIDWELNRRAQLLSMDIDEKGGLLSETEARNIITDTETQNNAIESEIQINNIKTKIVDEEQITGSTDSMTILINNFSKNLNENSIDLLTKRSKIDKTELMDLIRQLRFDGKILSPEPGFYLLI